MHMFMYLSANISQIFAFDLANLQFESDTFYFLLVMLFMFVNRERVSSVCDVLHWSRYCLSFLNSLQMHIFFVKKPVADEIVIFFGL